MPEPHPRPPQPRGMSIGRGLLLLLPSVPLLLAPFIAAAWSRAHDVQGEATIGPMLVASLIAFATTVVLSIFLGVRLEIWNRGAVQSLPRVIVYVLNILFTACFVALGGCHLLARLSRS